MRLFPGLMVLLMIGATSAEAGSLRVAPLASSPSAVEDLPTLAVEGIDRELLLAQDKLAEEPGIPLRFALPREVYVDLWSAGRWERTDRGTMVWSLLVESEGAVSLNLGFSRFVIPEGARLQLRSADGTSAAPIYTAADVRAHGELWTSIVDGSRLVIELEVPEDLVPQTELALAFVNAGYRELGSGAGPDKSGSCNVDVVCPQGDGYREVIRSVARFTRSGSILCSGVMLNNTAENYRPLFLTANHCGISTANDHTVVVYWNYQNSTCREPGSPASGSDGNGSLSQNQSGSTLLANFSSSDFALVELDAAPNAAWNVYWAGWDRRGINTNSAIAIHHPQGDEKRISFENDPVSTTSYLSNSTSANGTHFRVADWDVGTTEEGSSGSPLFDPSKRVIGQLHGGFAACGNDDPDWYGKLSVSWSGGGSASTRLSDWLDPIGTAPNLLAGRNLGAGGGGGGGGGGGATVPAAPTGLTATPLSTTEIRLAWVDNATNETEYRVEVQAPGESFVDIGAVGANTTGADVFGLSPATSYNFRVRARNATGNSAYSNTATATTAGAKPTAPSAMTAYDPSATTIEVRWNDRSNNETAFVVEFREVARRGPTGFVWQGGTWQLLAEVDANETGGQAFNLDPETIYGFRVKARNAAGDSAYSNEATATTRAGVDPIDCRVSERRLCLLEERFQVESFWRVQGSGDTGNGTAVPDSVQTGFFWFFSADNIELAVKALDGRPVNGKYWLFYGALSNVEYWIVVTDVVTGDIKTYRNPPGTYCGTPDTDAFDGDPSGSFAPLPKAAAAGPVFAGSQLPEVAAGLAKGTLCSPSATELCLVDGRFGVTATWTTSEGSGVGTAIESSTGDSSGYFWFFNDTNLELIVKVLDGRVLNNSWWVFYGALSNVEYTVTVRDYVTGEEAVYTNPAGNYCGVADIDALPPE